MSPEIIKKLKVVALLYFALVIMVLVFSQQKKGQRNVDVSLADQGFVAAADIQAPDTDKTVVPKGTLIDKDAIKTLLKNNVQTIPVYGKGKVIGITADFIFVILNFISLVVVLYYLLWKIVLDALDKRTEKIKADIADGEKFKEDSEKLNAERETELEEAHKLKEEIISKARNEADTERARILEEAKNESDQMIEDASRNIETMEQKLRTELISEVASHASAVAGKLLQREVDKNASDELTQKFLSSLRTENE